MKCGLQCRNERSEFIRINSVTRNEARIYWTKSWQAAWILDHQSRRNDAPRHRQIAQPGGCPRTPRDPVIGNKDDLASTVDPGQCLHPYPHREPSVRPAEQ